MKNHSRYAPFVLLAGGLAAAGCEPPAPPTTERIIRIQIEGCADAPSRPAEAAPTAPAAVSTPEQVAAARPPGGPPPATEEQAAEYASRRVRFLEALDEARFHPGDVAEAWQAYLRSADLFRARRYDEALHDLEAATHGVRDVKVGEPFVLEKFKRVEKRIESLRPRLSANDQAKISRRMAAAHEAFLNNAFKRSNAILYEVERQLDERSGGERGSGTRR